MITIKNNALIIEIPIPHPERLSSTETHKAITSSLNGVLRSALSDESTDNRGNSVWVLDLLDAMALEPKQINAEKPH